MRLVTLFFAALSVLYTGAGHAKFEVPISGGNTFEAITVEELTQRVSEGQVVRIEYYTNVTVAEYTGPLTRVTTSEGDTIHVAATSLRIIQRVCKDNTVIGVAPVQSQLFFQCFVKPH